MTDTALSVPALPKTDFSGLVKKAGQDKKSIHESAKNFEAMFMNEMMSYMFQGLETDGPFGGGHGEEVFRSLMVEQYGKKIAETGQTGIAASLEKEMLRMQEQQQNPNKLSGAPHHG